MVNSATFESDKQEADRNEKAVCTQPHNASSNSTHSSSPVTVSVALQCKPGFPQTADTNNGGGDGPSSVGAQAIEPTPSQTLFNNMPIENIALTTTDISSVELDSSRLSDSPSICNDDDKSRLYCSLPLEKVQGVLPPLQPPLSEEDVVVKVKPTRKLLCLYCDRSFVSANLRQKHVERIHSVKPNRRVSSRRQNQLTVTPCIYCDKLNSTENTLKDLFQHLVNEHSNKYFGCLPCEDRFLNSSHLADHNASNHQSAAFAPVEDPTPRTGKISPATQTLLKEEKSDIAVDPPEEIQPKITRSRLRARIEHARSAKLRNKKLTVKSSRIALKKRESKRLQAIAKAVESQKKKRSRDVDKRTLNLNKPEQSNSTKTTDKTKSSSTCINPYPEFDNFYRVKKITDHSIDNLKISSLTFDDVFDKAFFNRIKCNIEENLLHHIDGKLFKNEESESRISNFEKVSGNPQESQNSNPEHYGCELSLNAVTPVASLSLNSQYGEDFESQIEYGSKPSKKKSQTKTDEVHYKYFTRRKYQASILEHKENRDLSKLDMWTQLVIKKRQQKMLDETKSAKEMMDYTTGTEYRSKMKREELNRILDRRGPFEDLREEASKKAALDKLNSISNDSISHESFTDVQEILNEILDRVFSETESFDKVEEVATENLTNSKPDDREIPSYLNLGRKSSLPSDGVIDKSDKIALICSSQETENFELPTNQVRGKNEIIELSGEWARCRMYICAACGAKLRNMKNLIDHKSIYHQNVWVQHYEFVGNQSELYRHLSIPVLGKVGKVEETVPCKVWKRSDARLCTKCSKQCNSLGELHRHVLECGGDWTWMLVRKKCKYRPYGAKSRRKRRGLVSRIYHKQKTEPAEKKKYKKSFDGPRQRPSDADTIERMLANLPAKRSTRKLISLHDGIYRARKTNNINNKKKVMCGKVIYTSSKIKENTEKTVNNTRMKVSNKSQITHTNTKRKSLRSFTKVISSRILDTNKKLTVKRKLRVINERRKSKKLQEEVTDTLESINDKGSNNADKLEIENGEMSKTKRSSPRAIGTLNKMSVKKILTGKINIKSFFPVKKRKNKKEKKEITDLVASEQVKDENADSFTRSKRRSKDKEEIIETNTADASSNVKLKKSKNETLNKLVRSFSISKKSKKKTTVQVPMKAADTEDTKKNVISINQTKEQINETKSVKKRKLKENFKNVINRVKKMKIDNSTQYDGTFSSKSQQENKVDPTKSKEITFLDKSHLSDQSVAPQEKIIIPSTLEAKENLADISETALVAGNLTETKENPPIPENIFQLETKNEEQLQAKGELDFDSKPLIQHSNTVFLNTTEIEGADISRAGAKLDPISLDTSLKPKTMPLTSPNLKGKIKKPARGLNDCIAMLTSKLQQKETEVITKAHHVLPPVNPNKAVTNPIPHKAECILKIPTFKTNLIPSSDEALDLTVKKKDLKYDNYSIRPIYLTQPQVFSSIDQTINSVIKNKIAVVNSAKWQNVKNSVDETIQRVINDYKESSVLPIVTNKRNSVDDIIDFVITNNLNDIQGATSSLDFQVNPSYVKPKPTRKTRKVGCIQKLKIKDRILNPEEAVRKSVEIVFEENAAMEVNCKLNIVNLETKNDIVVPKSIPELTPNINIQDRIIESLLGGTYEKDIPLELVPPISCENLVEVKKDINLNTGNLLSALKLAKKRGRPKRNGEVKIIPKPKQNLQKSIILETNVDNLLSSEEINTNLGISTSPISIQNISPNNSSIKLFNEDEPHILEKKTVPNKDRTVLSESDEDIPLAALIKVNRSSDKSNVLEDASPSLLDDKGCQEITIVKDTDTSLFDKSSEGSNRLEDTTSSMVDYKSTLENFKAKDIDTSVFDRSNDSSQKEESGVTANVSNTVEDFGADTSTNTSTDEPKQYTDTTETILTNLDDNSDVKVNQQIEKITCNNDVSIEIDKQENLSNEKSQNHSGESEQHIPLDNDVLKEQTDNSNNLPDIIPVAHDRELSKLSKMSTTLLTETKSNKKQIIAKRNRRKVKDIEKIMSHTNNSEPNKTPGVVSTAANLLIKCSLSEDFKSDSATDKKKSPPPEMLTEVSLGETNSDVNEIKDNIMQISKKQNHKSFKRSNSATELIRKPKLQYGLSNSLGDIQLKLDMEKKKTQSTSLKNVFAVTSNLTAIKKATLELENSLEVDVELIKPNFNLEESNTKFNKCKEPMAQDKSIKNIVNSIHSTSDMLEVDDDLSSIKNHSVYADCHDKIIDTTSIKTDTDIFTSIDFPQVKKTYVENEKKDPQLTDHVMVKINKTTKRKNIRYKKTDIEELDKNLSDSNSKYINISNVISSNISTENICYQESGNAENISEQAIDISSGDLLSSKNIVNTPANLEKITIRINRTDRKSITEGIETEFCIKNSSTTLEQSQAYITSKIDNETIAAPPKPDFEQVSEKKSDYITKKQKPSKHKRNKSGKAKIQISLEEIQKSTDSEIVKLPCKENMLMKDDDAVNNSNSAYSESNVLSPHCTVSKQIPNIKKTVVTNEEKLSLINDLAPISINVRKRRRQKKYKARRKISKKINIINTSSSINKPLFNEVKVNSDDESQKMNYVLSKGNNDTDLKNISVVEQIATLELSNHFLDKDDDKKATQESMLNATLAAADFKDNSEIKAITTEENAIDEQNIEPNNIEICSKTIVSDTENEESCKSMDNIINTDKDTNSNQNIPIVEEGTITTVIKKKLRNFRSKLVNSKGTEILGNDSGNTSDICTVSSKLQSLNKSRKHIKENDLICNPAMKSSDSSDSTNPNQILNTISRSIDSIDLEKNNETKEAFEIKSIKNGRNPMKSKTKKQQNLCQFETVSDESNVMPMNDVDEIDLQTFNTSVDQKTDSNTFDLDLQKNKNVDLEKSSRITAVVIKRKSKFRRKVSNRKSKYKVNKKIVDISVDYFGQSKDENLDSSSEPKKSDIPSNTGDTNTFADSDKNLLESDSTNSRSGLTGSKVINQIDNPDSEDMNKEEKSRTVINTASKLSQPINGKHPVSKITKNIEEFEEEILKKFGNQIESGIINKKSILNQPIGDSTLQIRPADNFVNTGSIVNLEVIEENFSDKNKDLKVFNDKQKIQSDVEGGYQKVTRTKSPKKQGRQGIVHPEDSSCGRKRVEKVLNSPSPVKQIKEPIESPKETHNTPRSLRSRIKNAENDMTVCSKTYLPTPLDSENLSNRVTKLIDRIDTQQAGSEKLSEYVKEISDEPSTVSVDDNKECTLGFKLEIYDPKILSTIYNPIVQIDKLVTDKHIANNIAVLETLIVENEKDEKEDLKELKTRKMPIRKSKSQSLNGSESNTTYDSEGISCDISKSNKQVRVDYNIEESIVAPLGEENKGKVDVADNFTSINSDEEKINELLTFEIAEETNMAKLRSSRNRPLINYAEEDENFIESTELVSTKHLVPVDDIIVPEKSLETGNIHRKPKTSKRKKLRKKEKGVIEGVNASTLQSTEDICSQLANNTNSTGTLTTDSTENREEVTNHESYNEATGSGSITQNKELNNSLNKLEEPPIKIVINKHKTRRKSKSFKKVDHKGPNDLFEDFALVIKKPKGTAPIITFTPADTFSRDTDSNDMTSPIEMLPQKLTPTKSEIITANDESVEEMDMELDELPITSNIIERNDLNISLPLLNSDTDININFIETSKVTKLTKKVKPKRKVRKSVKKSSKLQTSKQVLDVHNKNTGSLEQEMPDIPRDNDLTIVEKDGSSCKNNEEINNHLSLGHSEKSLISNIYNDHIESNRFQEQNKNDFSEAVENVEALDDIQLDETMLPTKDMLESQVTSVPNEITQEVIDKIYEFSDTEDIEEPLEIPKRLPRVKTKSSSEIFDKLVEHSDFVADAKLTTSNIEDLPSIQTRKTRSGGAYAEFIIGENNKEKHEVTNFSTEVLKEDLPTVKPGRSKGKQTVKSSVETGDSIEAEFNVEKTLGNSVTSNNTKNREDKFSNEIEDIEDPNKLTIIGKVTNFFKQKPIRTAKAKALEHIHDDALADLSSNVKRTTRKLVTEENKSKEATKQNKKSKKVIKTPTILDTLNEKSPLLVDLVADLAGLEELENSIERELNEKDFCHESSELETSMDKQKVCTEDITKHTCEDGRDNQELRRSRRPRKVASYNENDVDSVVDDITSSKEIPKKYMDKNNVPDKKVNTDELFDMLKASTSTVPVFPPKPAISFHTNFDDPSKDNNNDDNFDNIFDNILEKSSLLIQDNFKRKNELKNMEKVFDFFDEPEISNQENTVELKAKHLKTNMTKVISSENSSASLISSNASMSQDSQDTEVRKFNSKETNYCEICNKSFIRVENLIKHKNTITHIQKLSEIETKLNTKDLIQEHLDETINGTSTLEHESRKSDINITSILNSSDKPSSNILPVVHSSFTNNHTLKLADIISDVLNKPVLDEHNSEIKKIPEHICQDISEGQSDYKRCKSLGERKSFDPDKTESPVIPESFLSKTTILEKQICLLENIIESQTSNYIDDISMSSNSSERQSNSGLSIKHDNITKPISNDESFLKPTQYEEISEDSANLRNYEDQKLRKTLNRDEELFLECCSLLKSGSEVSSYSNKKSQTKNPNRLATESVQDQDWCDQKNSANKSTFITDDYCDDNSRIPTPLGDSYDDGASDSNTISSNWESNKKENVNHTEILNTTFNLDEVLNNDREETKMAEDIKSKYKSPSNMLPQNEVEDGVGKDHKKIITKGARKVFEGLKVSIPTEDLNMEEVLNSSPKKNEFEVPLCSPTSSIADKQVQMSNVVKPSRSARKSKPVKKSQVGSNLLFKVKKKKIPSGGKNKAIQSENVIEKVNNYDVYDFEETQDNSDIFTKPDFRAFRNLKGNDMVEPESDIESRDYLDPCSVERDSITSTSISSLSSVKKSKAEENITKKKCMIMGRIFKNAAKSKLEDIDEEIRSIPNIDNDELVENYVANCKRVIKNEAKPKLTEKEINQLFDKLLENKNSENENENNTPKSTKSKSDSKKAVDIKKKGKLKNRKRARTTSDSTDDEFKLSNSSKRVSRKKAKAEDNCINLEQELKECIGVASRKSQRKCTSGKQNVLVEYWSSDESQFEALLETQRIESIRTNETPKIPEDKIIVPRPTKDKIEVSKEPEPPPKEINATSKQNLKQKKNVLKKKPSVDKKEKSAVAPAKVLDTSNRRKRAAVNPLYHWSSSSEDEMQDLIEVKPIRDEIEDDEDRPIQHGWIVGDSPKKLVTMLAQAKGKKTDIDGVKEQGKKRTNAVS